MAFLTSPITLVILAITALIAIIVLCVKHWDEIKEKVTEVVGKIKEKAGELKDKVVQKISDMKEKLSEIWKNIKSTASNVWNNIKTTIGNFASGIYNNVVNAFTNLKNSVVNIFNTIKNTVSNVWNAIWNNIKNVANSILGGIESMINGVINGLNGMINALNRVSFTAPDWVPVLGGKSFGFNIPNLGGVALPRLAKGGIVMQPTQAIIGEAGKEAVMPLENNTEWMDDMAEIFAVKLKEILEELGMGDGDNIPIEVILDSEIIQRVLARRNNNKKLATNGRWS